MASHLSLSLSESFQASLIIQHQEQRRRQRSKLKLSSTQHVPKDDDDTANENHTSTKGISLCVQCLLVALFGGMEMSAAFTMTYHILFLQFLGVPTSLLSMGGVVCGASVMVILPIIGRFVDRGSNPVKRKLKMLLISWSAYTIGYIGIIFCAVSKLHYIKIVVPMENNTINSNDVSNNFSHIISENYLPTSSHFLANDSDYPKTYVWMNSTNGEDRDSTTMISQPSGMIGYIGILSFATLDIAFDATMALGRAFVLECTPSFMHTRILIMATVFSSIAGTTFSLIATIDFAGILGPMFGVDGTAVTVLMFSIAIFTAVSCGIACTLITGYTVSRRYRGLKDTASIYGSERVESQSQSGSRRWASKSGLRGSSSTNKTLHGGSATDLLLGKNSLDRKSYSGLSTSSKGESTSESKSNIIPYQRILPPRENDVDFIVEDEPYNIKTKHQNKDEDDEDDGNDDRDNDNHSVITRSDSENEGDHDGYGKEGKNEEDKRDENGISNIMAGLIASYSMSMTVLQSSYMGDFQNWTVKRETQDLAVSTKGQEGDSGTNIWKSRRLKILLPSLCFAMGSLLSFATYHGNTLTIGIFHGNPTAPEGTKGKELYNKGLQTAALGNAAMYGGYAVLSLLNNKLIDLVGEKVLHVVYHVVAIVGMLAFVVFQTEELYFTSAVIAGAFRTCAFTLGYVLANKFVQGESGGGDSGKTSVGKLMVVVGMILPSQYLLLSAIMAPLISVTGNVWVPMISTAVTSILSLLVFSLLFVVKR